MDRTIWNNIKAAVDQALRAVPGRRGRRKQLYSDRLIVLMLLWTVWHDRCLSWACDRAHYNTLFRPRKLPSVSRFGRRVKAEPVQEVLRHAHEALYRNGDGTVPPPGLLTYIDGKAVTVSPVSKDPDAGRCKVCGAFAKGYKLHAFVDERRRVQVWSVQPLNIDEKTVAAALLERLPRGTGHTDTPAAIAAAPALTLGDSNYDAAPLHTAYAEHGRCLLTPLRCEQFVGPEGRHPRTLANMGPARRELIEVWEHSADLASYVLKSRNHIEGTFSVLSLACGLDRLPGFVRRLDRVTRWVGCKILLYHARLLAQEAAEAAAA